MVIFLLCILGIKGFKDRNIALSSWIYTCTHLLTTRETADKMIFPVSEYSEQLILWEWTWNGFDDENGPRNG